jgi:hypothetical protein
MTKNRRIYSWEKFKILLVKKIASIKYVQATGEAFSPQERTSSTSKHEIS